mmetsp:Transcript_22045/g.49891  ORF Transcript_22045/g.49891 Transcript_22045/m.49891 type:complete len:230 (+) Transcript_22045:237-926(+)|eukprot:CAMPEP_0172626484 /NCGR_PEP_ID=MMETSP1068-20121228/150560_1 /TAXON_ID=35684 /ORGANISM="Pseudopedinella elastica, Strain CCMP716" /LENGTH=229 /DNA_ID=CAMNT_0013436107 /DNA_START=105 /DNA_END=794 /DNA_ORIENTATION=-
MSRRWWLKITGNPLLLILIARVSSFNIRVATLGDLDPVISLLRQNKAPWDELVASSAKPDPLSAFDKAFDEGAFDDLLFSHELKSMLEGSENGRSTKCFLVATNDSHDGARVVGSICSEAIDATESGGLGVDLQGHRYVSHLAVDNECRRLGIGRALIKNSLEPPSDSDRIPCCLFVDQRNLAALEFYRRVGFTEICRHSESKAVTWLRGATGAESELFLTDSPSSIVP